jgi:hypothetical protein
LLVLLVCSALFVVLVCTDKNLMRRKERWWSRVFGIVLSGWLFIRWWLLVRLCCFLFSSIMCFKWVGVLSVTSYRKVFKVWVLFFLGVF